MRLMLLRNLLLLDCAVLLLLGVLFLFAPGQVEALFRFQGLPHEVRYILAMYGCVLATLSLGYFIAATDPARHVAWVQVGIARGALECLVGIVYVAQATVGWRQAAFGIAVAAFMTAAYAVLYPREPTAEVSAR